MAITNKDAERLNLISPATSEIGLGDIVQGLQSGGGGTPGAGSITTTMLADGSVTSTKLGPNSVAVVNLGSDVDTLLAGKLTATKAAAQANSTATDAAGIVTDFNALLAKLRTAGLLT